MTQCDRILQFIEEHGSITELDARNMKPSILRLSARILDLRTQGNNIVTEIITGKNEYGTWRCARYKKAV